MDFQRILQAAAHLTVVQTVQHCWAPNAEKVFILQYSVARQSFFLEKIFPLAGHAEIAHSLDTTGPGKVVARLIMQVRRI